MSSIKEIAKICGVSSATVSKALNDKEDIGEDTKKRIKEVAKEMGYFPQYYAKAIRMNKSYNIGVLFADEAMSGLTHDYFANILNSFKEVAESRGYDITFINSNAASKKGRTFLEHCRYRGLDGVMIACIRFEHPEVIELLESDIPVVTIDYLFPGRISVMSNNSVGMRDLTEYVISMGHNRIAYIFGEPSSVTEQRLMAFHQVMGKYALKIPKEYIISSEYRNLEKAAAYTRQLLELQEPPTCILYPDDYSAVGGINQIRAMGLRIPEDISVAGFDGIFLAEQLRPRLTTVFQATEEIGNTAAEKLIALIEGKTSSRKTALINTKLRIGDSIGKRNESNTQQPSYGA